MTEPKYYQVKILRPSGLWDIRKVPTFFSPSDVAAKCPHSLLAVTISGKSDVWLASEQQFRKGPLDAIYNRNKGVFTHAYRDITKVGHLELYNAEVA